MVVGFRKLTEPMPGRQYLREPMQRKQGTGEPVLRDLKTEGTDKGETGTWGTSAEATRDGRTKA